MVSAVLGVALVAISLALDVFAVCVGVGIRGATLGAKFRIGAAFATSEVFMNLCGVGIGSLAGRAIGDIAAYIGFAALVGIGAYTVMESLRGDVEQFDLSRGFGLIVASLSISVDSLGVGFSIVYLRVPVPITLGAIAFASVCASSLGLAFGSSFGRAVGPRAGLFAGFALMATGALFAILKFLHIQ
jgi:putative Mn2+ efflux pump MntP